MPSFIRAALLAIVAAVLACTQVGCSREAKKARLLEQANQAFAAGKFDEAEIDYKNVLKIDGLNTQAIAGLGVIYFDQGRLSRSFPFILKSRELQPSNLELRVKLGQLYQAFGQSAEARAEAQFVLDRKADNFDATLLLADAAGSAKEITEARERLKRLPEAEQASASGLLASGILAFRQRQVAEAETDFQRALALDGKSPETNAALGILYQFKGEAAKADEAFGAAARYSPPRSPRRLQYARFKIQTGDSAGARRLLEEMAKTTPDYLPGLVLLAQLSAAEQKYDAAAALISQALSRDAGQPEAMLLSGRIELARGNAAKAIEETQKFLRMYPKAAQGHHQLALAYLATNEADKAAASLTQALTLSPNYTEAAILLAELNNRKGDYSATIIAMKQALQQRAELAQAWLLLGDAYRLQANYSDALGVYLEMAKRFPKAPQPVFFSGIVYAKLNQRTEAREAFNRTLAMAPDSLQAVEQLVALDFADGKIPAALQRVEEVVTRNPKAAAPYVLLARVLLAQKEEGKAEEALRTAINVQPDYPEAYYLLAGIYFANKQAPKALADLNGLIAKNPRDIRALMLAGVLQTEVKDYAGARTSYENTLAVNPRFAAALNNLACLYSEQCNDLDKASDAAQRARELLPQDPHVADTFGWILYKKRQYVRAAAVLDESARRLPDSAELQYHLGMALYMLGKEEGARAALQRALQSGATFPGAEDARNSMAMLNLNPASISRTVVDKALAERPDDPMALAALANIFEREGSLAKAIDTNQAALKASPTNVKVMLNLARIYTAQKDTAKALEFAKAARKAAPNDPAAAQALGRLAFATGDFGWAASLLQEAVQRSPENAEVGVDFAQAAFAVGRIGEAEAALKSAIEGKLAPARAARARLMLKMIDLANNPIPSGVADAEKVLQSEPDDLPALMARAALYAKQGNASRAKEIYEQALGRYADFVPAKRALALYYARNPGDDQKAFDLAAKAREAFPSDPDVAKALGMIVLRRGDFLRAVGLLTECADSRPDDAESLYYLGIAQARLGRAEASNQSLRKALDLGLPADLASNANKELASRK